MASENERQLKGTLRLFLYIAHIRFSNVFVQVCIENKFLYNSEEPLTEPFNLLSENYLDVKSLSEPLYKKAAEKINVNDIIGLLTTK